MTKDVLIRISGMQFATYEEETENEPIEVINSADYFLKNGKHYILFEEVLEGGHGVTKNQIKIDGDSYLEVKKKGIVNVRMVFEKGAQHLSTYETPYGQLVLGIHTTDMVVTETEDNINVRVEYEMEANYEKVADCKILINIRPRDAKDFNMKESMTF